MTSRYLGGSNQYLSGQFSSLYGFTNCGLQNNFGVSWRRSTWIVLQSLLFLNQLINSILFYTTAGAEKEFYLISILSEFFICAYNFVTLSIHVTFSAFSNYRICEVLPVLHDYRVSHRHNSITTGCYTDTIP